MISNFPFIETPIQKVSLPWLDQRSLMLDIKRDDMIHPFVSGNKWRKLKFNYLQAVGNNSGHLISCGGAYSNHLIALACLGASLGIQTTGFVRGDELSQSSNYVLRLCAEFGMDLKFIKRSDYSELRKSPHLLEEIDVKPGLWIPEGGSNAAGVLGCSEIVSQELTAEYDHIFVSVGTGTTLAGILCTNGLKSHVHGVCAVNDLETINNNIATFVRNKRVPYTVHSNYSFGGFAKSNETLREFSRSFTASTGILLDPVYTSKMMYAINQEVEKEHFQPGSKILAIHTGGLTGILSKDWLTG